MSTTNARLSLGFSCIGHTYSHLFGPIFYVAALSLERDLGLTHGGVVILIVAGNVLFGLAAPLAGWLSDRWSATGMIGVFFIGTGASMVMTGLSETGPEIAFWLAVTGIFASIYHPVGLAWLIRNAVNKGLALGFNGLFGGLGPAIAALSAGALIENYGWQAAFIIPGAVVMATGGLYWGLIARGLIVETKTDLKPMASVTGSDRIRVFVVLGVTMLGTGLIYQATQAAMPKLFSERLVEWTGGGVMAVSSVVAAVYVAGGLMQIIGGRLADIYPLKTVYLCAFLLQIPFLFLAGILGGPVLVVVVLFMVSINTGSLPTENVLVARYAPARWRSLAFGLKFVLALGVSGLGVLLEGAFYDLTGGFYWVFTLLAAIAFVSLAIAMLLPAEKLHPVRAAAE
jgi:MFS family permease